MGKVAYHYAYENMTLKITLKSPTTLKNFTKDYNTEICSLITLTFARCCYPIALIPYNLTEIFKRYSYPLFSQFLAILWFFSVFFSVIFS